MPFDLLLLAEKEGIRVEYWDFQPPLEAVYLALPGLPSVIGLSRSLFDNRAHFRCVLAEELGHYFTTVGDAVPKTHYHYHNRLEISRAEYRALRWAAQYLIPLDKLLKAARRGVCEKWMIAEYFDVTDEMVDFRLKLPDLIKAG